MKHSTLFASGVQSVIGAVVIGATALLAAPASAAIDFAAIPGSVRATTDVTTGEFNSARMSVEVVLAPRNASQLSDLLTSLYNPNSQSYGHWLGRGQFDSLFAPGSAQTAAVAGYLRASGLIVQQSSPFLVRASGSSSTIAATFRTSLRTYRNPKGITYFSNASAVQLPASLAAGVLGVVGLSNTVRLHPQLKRLMSHTSSSPSCEAPYPTTAQLFAAVNSGTPFPFGYGGGPGCSGLTPSQVNSIYGAPKVGPRGKGAGVNLAVFEQSAYQHSDIATWVQYFYGHAFTAPLVDINVDGGPLNPVCPSGDTCPPNINGYSGDFEVDLDIEMQLAVSPAAKHILVYNAPGDNTGQTSLDEYAQIANDDAADAVSTSWGVCENDSGASYAQAQNVIFEQMALQGQSMFDAAGDWGPYDCISSDNTTILNVDENAAQPWVTGVGGTSLESFNPGANPRPAYPEGVETVWNVDNLCNSSSNEGGHTGFFWCDLTIAGGGGSSQYWGRPFYQFGPGVTNPYTTYGNGTTQCSFAAIGRACREVPDVSAIADQFTPLAAYCTGNAATPYSICATFTGWFGAAGTSLSSPFWSAIFADRDSYTGHRWGNANPLLYLLYNLDRHRYFHDITGVGQTTNNNGLFPTTPGYDLATGIGTPKMSAIITGFP